MDMMTSKCSGVGAAVSGADRRAIKMPISPGDFMLRIALTNSNGNPNEVALVSVARKREEESI